MFAIVTDTLSDLPLEWCEDHNVKLVATHLTGRAGDRRDVVGVHPADTYVALATRPDSVGTSQPSAAEFTEAFEAVMGAGFDEVVCVTASAALSSSYDSAVAAARAANRRGRVVVIDSRSVSAGEGIVVADLVRARDTAMTMDQAVDHVARLIHHVTVLFITPPGSPLFKHPSSRASLGRMRATVERWLGLYGLVTLDEKGRVSLVGHSADQRMHAGRIARLMSLDSQREGPLSYVEVSVGYPRSLSVLEKPLDTNEFMSRRHATINASGAMAVHLGLGALGMAYAPVAYLVADGVDIETGATSQG